MSQDDDLQRYLDAACQGLYGLERQTIRDELEANLLERVRDFQVMGCSRDEALKKALEEFGVPSRVSRGMREVYVMPRVMKGGALAGLLAMGVYLAVGSSVAGPVETTYRGPCGPQCDSMGMSFVDVGSLEQGLRAQGLAVTRDSYRLNVPLGSGKNGEISIFPNGGGNSDTAVFWRNHKLYVPTFEVLNLLAQSNKPVTVSSLKNPTLKMGAVNVALAGTGRALELRYPMSKLVSGWLCKADRPLNPDLRTCAGTAIFSNPAWLNRNYELRLSKPHALYAVLLPLSDTTFQKADGTPIKFGDSWRIDVLQADSSGKLIVQDDPRNVGRSLEFATSVAAFRQKGAKRALLLELSDRLDAGAQNFRVVTALPPLEHGPVFISGN